MMQATRRIREVFIYNSFFVQIFPDAYGVHPVTRAGFIGDLPCSRRELWLIRSERAQLRSERTKYVSFGIDQVAEFVVLGSIECRDQIVAFRCIQGRSKDLVNSRVIWRFHEEAVSESATCPDYTLGNIPSLFFHCTV